MTDLRFWNKWDEEKRESAVRIIGLCAGAIAVFIFIAMLSYLFHWRQDMSLPEEVGNKAGSLGYRTGRFLITECFGLGSFAFPVILIAVAVRLLSAKWPYSLLKTLVVCLSGAFLASLALAFAGSLAGMGQVFGAGLGGGCGTAIVNWAQSLIGGIFTGIAIALLILCWLVFSSRRFSVWFSHLGEGREKKEKKSPKEEVDEEMAELEEEEELPQEETVVAPPAPVQQETEPEPEPEPEPEKVQETEQKQEGTFEIVTDDKLDRKVEELKPFDNRLDPPDGLPRYKFPSIDILENHSSARRDVSTEELTRNNNKIRAALANYKIQVVDVKAQVGPTVTLYKVYPAPGVKISDIKKLQEDIALSLNAKGVRVVTLSDSVGIEVANDYSSIVPLKNLLNDETYRNSTYDLPVAIGYTITQKVKVFDLADAPHLLVAGATKQGKSVGLNVIVTSLLYSKHPSELKFVFIDPKMVEFTAYNKLIKHYLAVLPENSEEEEINNAIVKSPKNAEKVLRSLCIEMDQRYELLSKANVNNIKLYNKKYKERHLLPTQGHKYLPYLVTVVDEYADLTMTVGAAPDAKAASRSITNSIIRLAQKGRAAGIHVILATQRPSVDVISGLIKSNFPARIAFRVASRVDSMTIIDAPGAEKLIGKGDMLYSAGIDTERIQCAFISNDEIISVTSSIGEQNGYQKCYNTPYYLPPIAEEGAEGSMIDMNDLDERFEEAARLVVTTQKGSTSDLQRKLGMGYAKAGRVMDQLEAAGIVGPQEGSKPRQVLVPDFNALQPILDSFRK